MQNTCTLCELLPWFRIGCKKRFLPWYATASSAKCKILFTKLILPFLSSALSFYFYSYLWILSTIYLFCHLFLFVWIKQGGKGKRLSLSKEGWSCRDHFLNSIGYRLIQSLQNFEGHFVIFCTKQSPFDINAKTTRK